MYTAIRYSRIFCSAILFVFSCRLIAQQPAVQVPPPEVVLQFNGEVVAPPDSNTYESQLESKLHVEAAFLRRAVKLSNDQESRLGAISIKSLELNRVNERKVAPGIEFQPRITVNGVRVIDPLQMRRWERSIDKALDALLTDEQRAVYKTEKEKRKTFEREVAIEGIMLLLNKKLGLTDSQSRTIRSKLADWSEVGNVVVEYYLMKDYFPPVPAETVVPFLDEKQIKIFDSASRTQVFNWPNPFVPGDVKIER